MQRLNQIQGQRNPNQLIVLIIKQDFIELMYYGARNYNPEQGQFIQADKQLPEIYDPQQLNRYAYARNNPYKYIDKEGKELFSVTTLVVTFLVKLVVASTLMATISETNDLIIETRKSERIAKEYQNTAMGEFYSGYTQKLRSEVGFYHLFGIKKSEYISREEREYISSELRPRLETLSTKISKDILPSDILSNLEAKNLGLKNDPTFKSVYEKFKKAETKGIIKEASSNENIAHKESLYNTIKNKIGGLIKNE